MRSDLIDITMQLHHETEKAVLASNDGEREKAVWLPKTAIEIERTATNIAIITMPERLAIEKGLV
jgi:hypothetical protein